MVPSGNILKIAILGCGWLGLPLGKALVEKECAVNGSTTDRVNFIKLSSNGIVPFSVKVTDQEVIADRLEDFLNASVLIVNFPPERREDVETYHSAQVEILMKAIRHSAIEKVLFISSTSVYPDTNGEVTELEQTTATKPSGKALLAAEKLFMQETSFATTILRLAGLIGGDRIPGRFLAGKKNLKNGNVPVNLIHRYDCIGIIKSIIFKNIWGEVFNACAPIHPKRKEFYMVAAQTAGLSLPEFDGPADEAESFKVVNSEKLIRRTGYMFKYPDPMDLLRGSPD